MNKITTIIAILLLLAISGFGEGEASSVLYPNADLQESLNMLGDFAAITTITVSLIVLPFSIQGFCQTDTYQDFRDLTIATGLILFAADYLNYKHHFFQKKDATTISVMGVKTTSF